MTTDEILIIKFCISTTFVDILMVFGTWGICGLRKKDFMDIVFPPLLFLVSAWILAIVTTFVFNLVK